MTESTLHESRAADVLAALGNRTRLQVFRTLVKAGDDGLNVGDLQEHLGIPPSTLAHHLQTLARTGLVQQERQGREIISWVNFDMMHGLVHFLTAECCSGLHVPALGSALTKDSA